MTYVLHYAPDNASLIVRLALDHVGADYETRLVDRRRGQQRSPAFLALNPNGLIPALETPDGVMTETGAILLYLSERHAGLMPDGGPARAMALKWLFWLSNTLHPAQRLMFYPDQYCTGDAETLRAPGRDRIARMLGILSDSADAPWLDGRPCAMGFYLGPLLRWLDLYGGRNWFTLSTFPRLMTFAQQLETVPAVTQAAAAEGLGPKPFSAPTVPNPPEGSAL